MPQNTFAEVNDAIATQEMVMNYEKSQKQGKAIVPSKATAQTIVNSIQSGHSKQANNKRNQEEPPYQNVKTVEGYMLGGVESH